MQKEEEEQRREEEETGGDQAVLLEGHLMQVPALGIKPNCERLSPQSLLDGPEDEPAPLNTIFIDPLDGSQAELRGRVIKEVRKPGRSESQLLRGGTWFYSHLPVSKAMKNLEKSWNWKSNTKGLGKVMNFVKDEQFFWENLEFDLNFAN